MALSQEKAMFFWLVISIMSISASSRRVAHYTPPALRRLTDLFPHLTFNQGFKEYYGGSNIKLMDNGSFVSITLDKSTGSGFASQNYYNYGFFSAAIKLPPGLSSGVVVAFYMSNAEMFPHNHDEIDIELLGHENRKEWILQTNVYANGSVKVGREEKFHLWFDPTQQHHSYSVIWNNHHTVFLVDNVPIREITHSEAVPSSNPSKPMSLYCTIWDGSDWATNGGKNPVDYKNAPFTASFGSMQIEGCLWDKSKNAPLCMKNGQGLSSLDPIDGQDFAKLSQEQKLGMDGFRKRFMIYSYCKDKGRYKNSHHCEMEKATKKRKWKTIRELNSASMEMDSISKKFEDGMKKMEEMVEACCSVKKTPTMTSSTSDKPQAIFYQKGMRQASKECEVVKEHLKMLCWF